MSTANFSKKNASKYFAVDFNNEDDGASEMGYQWLVENLQEEFYSKKDLWESGNRSYEGKIVAQVEKEFGKWAIEFDIIIRNGYYSGVNLDWECRIIDTVERTENYYEEIDEVGVPKNVRKWIDNRIKKIENIFSVYSTPLICTARFSNGEAIYQRCTN